jgi:uncharacterized protein YceK
MARLGMRAMKALVIVVALTVLSGCSSTYWHDAYWEHQRKSGYFQDLTASPDACKAPVAPSHQYLCEPKAK